MKMIRKMTALLLALCVALGAVSCSSADQSWSAEKDGDRLPVGVYVYNLYAAISLAQTQDGVDTSANLLEQEIDGQPAEEWIRNEAMRMTKEIYYLRSELEARGIPLTDDEQTQAESLASSQWGYVPDSVKKYVSLDSFTIAYGELSVMMRKLFDSMYGEGGEREVSEDELRTQFESTYYDFDYVLGSLQYKTEAEMTGAEGESDEMTDEEAEERKALFDGYAADINNGAMTMEQAAQLFADLTGSTDTEPSHELVNNDTLESSFPSEVKTALDEMGAGETRSIEVTILSKGVLLMRKNDITADTDEFLADENNREVLLTSLKADEFTGELDAAVDAFEGVTFNDAALSGYHPSEFYTAP